MGFFISRAIDFLQDCSSTFSDHRVTDVTDAVRYPGKWWICLFYGILSFTRTLADVKVTEFRTPFGVGVGLPVRF